MARYAEKTEVGTGQSKTEIERTLLRYGADQFAYAWNGTEAVIGFRIANRQVKIGLPLPAPEDDEFVWTATRQRRTANSQKQAYEQACRQRWRALALVIKAKLEAVECGISTIEREFMDGLVTPNGMTVGEMLLPQIEAGYAAGKMPPLLLGPT